MSKLVKLYDHDGDTYLVNPDHVVVVSKAIDVPENMTQDQVIIALANGKRFPVVGTENDIANKLGFEVVE